MLIVAGVGVTYFAVWSFAAQRRPAASQPKITWSESQIELILSPGESASKELTFTSTQDLNDITIWPVPELAPFLSVQPESFANVPANQPQHVRLDFSASETAPLGTYDGTIHIRSGSRTLPHTLKIIIHIAGVGAAIFLPPDPGEAGKETLEGIDSDGDGVRDDIQRYIAFTYPSSERTRSALFQYARVQQMFILSSENRDAARLHAQERTKANLCLFYIRFDDAGRILDDLQAEVLNTLLRSSVYARSDAALSGTVVSLPTDKMQWKEACEFDPDVMRN